MIAWFFPFFTNSDELTTKGRIKRQTKLVTAKSLGPANHTSQPLHLLGISMHMCRYAVARGGAGLCYELLFSAGPWIQITLLNQAMLPETFRIIRLLG